VTLYIDAAVVSDGVFFKEAKYQKVIKTSENCFECKIIEVHVYRLQLTKVFLVIWNIQVTTFSNNSHWRGMKPILP